jgi:hypothetical protein
MNPKFISLLLFLGLLSCNLTEKHIVGSYQEKFGKKITIRADSTASIEVEINDTVLTVLYGTKMLQAKWRLTNSRILLTACDTNFRWLNTVYMEYKRNKIITDKWFDWQIGHEKYPMVVYKKTN